MHRIPAVCAKRKMRPIFSALGMLFFLACTEDTGCDGMLPLEAPLAEDAYEEQAVALFVSEQGVNFLESNLLSILSSFAQTACDTLPCPSDLGACDTNDNCISSDPNAPLVGLKVESSSFTGGELCPADDTGFDECNVYILLQTMELTPTDVDADLLIDMDVDVITSLFKVSVLGGTCDMTIETLDKTVSTTMSFSNDNPLERLEVELGALDFAITEEDMDKIDFSGGFLGSCNIVDLIFPFFQDTVNEELQSTLQETIDEALQDLLWEPCVDDPCSRADVSTCVDGWCRFDGTDEPVPALIGLEGRMDLAALLAEFAPGAEGMIDFSLGANDGSALGAGLQIDMRGGTAVGADPCVPILERPANTYPAFLAPPLTPAGESFDLAVGISDSFLNRMMHGAFSGGALCLSLGGDLIPQLNSSAFSLLTPSLSELVPATRPLTVDIRPRALPRIEIGRNLLESSTEEPPVETVVEPLMTLVLDDFEMDLYVPMPEALVRIMTLRLDLAIDLGLAIGGEGELVLVAGDGTDWVLNAVVQNSEILREAPTDIEDAIPVLLGIVLPLLTESLNQSFDLPTASGFSFDVKEISGTQIIGETVRAYDRFAHMTLFADLDFNAEEAMRQSPARTQARVQEMHFPSDEEVRDGVWSEVVLDVGVQGRDSGLPPPVVWVRVDGGLWHYPVQGNRLTVRDIRLQVPGPHFIEVAAAIPGAPETLDPNPVQLKVNADFAAPTLTIAMDPSGELQIQVKDDVDRPDELSLFLFENNLAQRFPPVSAAGEAYWRPRDSASHILIEVRDRAGHRTWSEWGTPRVRGSASEIGQVWHAAPAKELRQDFEAQSEDLGVMHCASSAGANSYFLLGTGLLWVFGHRRSRRVSGRR